MSTPHAPAPSTPLSVIVGGNRGIGLALARALVQRGTPPLVACRTSSPELDALDLEVVSGVEIRQDAGVGALVAAVGDRPIARLFVVAGLLRRETLDELDFDAIRDQLETNALGPLRVVAALRHNLTHGSTVALLTSRMGSIEDNTSGGGYGYRMSKAALNMAGRSLAHDLRDQGVTVLLLHPGWVRTQMTGHTGNATPEEAAAGLLARTDELGLPQSGTFWHASGERLPW